MNIQDICKCISLRAKDEVLEKFMEHVNQAEKLGKHVKNLRSDNGEEYCSKEFDDYLKAKGITRQSTVPYCPEQNGISGRMNRTPVEAARSMMFYADMPKRFGLKQFIQLHMYTTEVKQVR